MAHKGAWQFHIRKGRTLFWFWLALVALRLQIVVSLGAPLGKAVSLGLIMGLYQDLIVTLAAYALSRLLALLPGVRWIWTWTLIGTLVWLLTMTNTLYLRFFGSRMEWWILKFHFNDVGDLGGSIGAMANAYAVMASAVLFLISYPWKGWLKRYQGEHGRVLRFGEVVLLLVAAQVLNQIPVWKRIDRDEGSPYADQPVITWAHQAVHEASPDGRYAKDLAAIRSGTYRPPLEPWLAYREWDGPRLAPAARKWRWHFATPPTDTQKLRDEFGLPRTGPIHVIVLFLESARYLEWGDPKVGPEVFSDLREQTSRRGIVFERAYSSASYTDQGQFSVMCSFLPNLLGAPTYQSFPNAKVSCLAELFRDQGYETVYTTGVSRKFARMEQFESFHGTDHFYDEAFFEEHGVTGRISGWGKDDGPMLQVVIRQLESLAKSGRPVMASVATMSTHLPWSMVPEGPLSPALKARFADQKSYLGFLSKFKYSQKAVTDFIERLWSGPLGDRSLLVMVGDHSVDPRMPKITGEMPGWMESERRSRVFLAMLSKRLHQPRVVHTPVHQIDIAPTILRIAGIGGEVTFMGRDLFGAAGSPMIFATADVLHYQTRDHGCYSERGSGLRCWNLRDSKDRLYASSPPPSASENEAETRLARDTFDSIDRLIWWSALAP